MPIFEIFSKRQKRLRGEMPDVFQYDTIPQQLKVQVIHIFREVFGSEANVESEHWSLIHQALTREYGVFHLADVVDPYGYETTQKALEVVRFFLQEQNAEKSLDVIELGAKVISQRIQTRRKFIKIDQAKAAIAELNARFSEHAVGFQFESEQIIRVDSSIIHAEVVKPALALLRDPRFAGANEEYLSAYDHYRHGRIEESLTDALKCFESTMKSICNSRGWSYSDKSSAKELLDVCFAKQLLPSHLQAEFNALRATLEAGVPTVRNKQGAHGQGPRVRVVPRCIASYALHLTAANVLLLVSADKELA
jgi:hypothetical protein